MKLVWIVNDSARKASFKKRRAGLLKKVNELTTLCGVSAFVIIYGPDDAEPAVWPTRQEVHRLLTRFQRVPDIERCKKMMNQESYIRERSGKMQEQLRRHHRKNRDMEMARVMHQIHRGKPLIEFEAKELTGLAWMLEEKMKEIRRRVEYFQQAPLPLPGSFHQRNTEPPGQLGGRNSIDGRTSTTPPMSKDSFWGERGNNSDKNGGGGGSSTATTLKSDVGQQFGTLVRHPYANYRGAHNNSGVVNGSEMGLGYESLGRGNDNNNNNANNINAGNDINVVGLVPQMNYGGNGMPIMASSINIGGSTEMKFGLQAYNNQGYVGADVNYNVDVVAGGNRISHGGGGGNNMGIEQFPIHNGSNNYIEGSCSSVNGSEMGLLPPGLLFSGGSAAGISDAGLPFDVSKCHWPAPFSP